MCRCFNVAFSKITKGGENMLRRLLKKRRGQALWEYLFVLILIMIVIVAILAHFWRFP